MGLKYSGGSSSSADFYCSHARYPNPLCKKMTVNTWTGLLFIALSQQPLICHGRMPRYHVIFFFFACRVPRKYAN